MIGRTIRTYTGVREDGSTVTERVSCMDTNAEHLSCLTAYKKRHWEVVMWLWEDDKDQSDV